MLRPLASILLALFLGSAAEATRAAAAPADPADTLTVEHPEVVVSATRTPRDQINVPNATAVVTRKELRQRAVHTFAEALQDVVGLDTGEGSDNGTYLPNVGMYGLKEFDALLFTLNGVPVGGPFNPSLSQLPIEDIDRIEVVKGPQGTMYGVSAFAGMIQVFTPEPASGGAVSVSGGSFSGGKGSVNWGKSLGGGRNLRLSGSFANNDGWQDRTSSDVGRGGATLGMGLGRGRLTLDVASYRHHQEWGSPLPYDSGELVPGFVIDRNYAVGGAKVQHTVFSGTARLTLPVGSHHLENTLGYAVDEQEYLRSFPGEVSGDTLTSEGLELEPRETSLYEDLRWIGKLNAAGTHELIAGAAVTWGETKGEGREFSFDQFLSGYPNIPDAGSTPSVEDREFEDMRTFYGFYVHDAWTPTWRVTLEGGGRFDAVSEELETEADLPSGPVPVADHRDDADFSGDFSVLYRLVPAAGAGVFQAANVYGSVRRAFKPAAPNLAEAEAAEILEPEHTTSWEAGIKARMDHGVSFNLSWFDMTFENMVVSILGTGGLPELTNAGEERFKGIDTEVQWSPEAVPGSSIAVGYGHHDAQFVDFTFVTPDGQFRDVSGKRLELVPEDMVNARASLRTPSGVGGYFALRYQGERPFNRRNTFFAEAFTEFDAGLSFDRGPWSLVVIGRNLGDDRHVVTESEIGDAQFYPAPPRRFMAEASYHF